MCIRDSIEIVTKAGFADRFMGVSQQAHFIGHGIGLEINQAPVLAQRIRRELEAGMVFSLEPKIVLPGVGPVGIENSWANTIPSSNSLRIRGANTGASVSYTPLFVMTGSHYGNSCFVNLGKHVNIHSVNHMVWATIDNDTLYIGQ